MLLDRGVRRVGEQLVEGAGEHGQRPRRRAAAPARTSARPAGVEVDQPGLLLLPGLAEGVGQRRAAVAQPRRERLRPVQVARARRSRRRRRPPRAPGRRRRRRCPARCRWARRRRRRRAPARPSGRPGRRNRSARTRSIAAASTASWLRAAGRPSSCRATSGSR